MKLKKLQIAGIEVTDDLTTFKCRKDQINTIEMDIEVVRKDQAILNELAHLFTCALSTAQLWPCER